MNISRDSSRHLIQLPVLALCLFTGCSDAPQGGQSIKSAKTVTYDELENATKQHEYLEYCGMEDSYGYFYANNQGYFRVQLGWTNLSGPSPPQPAGLSDFRLFVRIENGKVVDKKVVIDD